jgi:hypothetical protein
VVLHPARDCNVNLQITVGSSPAAVNLTGPFQDPLSDPQPLRKQGIEGVWLKTIRRIPVLGFCDRTPPSFGPFGRNGRRPGEMGANHEYVRYVMEVVNERVWGR